MQKNYLTYYASAFSNGTRFIFCFAICLQLMFGFAQNTFAQPAGVEYKYAQNDTDGIPLPRYKERRERFMSKLTEQSVAVFFSAEVKNRQNDVDYEYRQDNSLFYLCGMSEANSALMLIPRGIQIDSIDTTHYREILFVQKRNPQREMWTGVIMGIENARKYIGVAKCVENSRFAKVLQQALSVRDTLFLSPMPQKFPSDAAFGIGMFDEKQRKNSFELKFPNVKVKSPTSILAKMREVKDEDEIRLMQKAIDISIAGHKEAMQQAKSGMAEYELEAIMEYNFHKYGAEDVGYPSIVGSKTNGCILHYTSNRRLTQKGELVLMDCGAEYHGYSADITRTFPISGTFSPEQKIIYNIVLEAQDSGFAACKVGNGFRVPHSKAVSVVKERLLALGIIQEADEFSRYFPHGTSHYLGLDVHDAGTFGKLQTGNVITIEPGIYIPEGSPCDSKWWNIGIRIEDDVLITQGEPVVMSKTLPRTAKDIENLMMKDSNQKMQNK